MSRGERLAALVMAGAVLAVLGLALIPKEGFLQPPFSWTKGFALASIALLILTVPLGLYEEFAARRYEGLVAQARQAHPDATVLPYEGPEGGGLLFEAPGQRFLVLRPAGGLGSPRVVDAPDGRLTLAR